MVTLFILGTSASTSIVFSSDVKPLLTLESSESIWIGEARRRGSTVVFEWVEEGSVEFI